MHSTPTAAPTVADSEPFKDVWTRSGTTYRTRAIVLLVVNVLLFGGLGCFAYWLRSGEPFAPILPNYVDEILRTARFTGDMKVTLASFLVGPMSVREVPALVPIVGLLLAALVAIPILVAILYRFWAALPFIAVVGFLAVMPWLAVTLLASCVLASVKPFRREWRFASALVGLLPVGLYLILASRGSGPHIGDVGDPMDKIRFLAPWVIAMVAATVLAALVLLIAKIVDYRPGALAPLMAVMFGLPVALFEFKVGRDELYYRLLERELRLFQDVSAADVLERRAEETWLDQPEPRVDFQVWKSFVEVIWNLEVSSPSDTWTWASELTRVQQTLADHCDAFLKYFPDSRYACNALFIKGRALCTRVDLSEFRKTRWIRYYDDFPSRASRAAWRGIEVNRPDSPLAAVALLRLAQLDARQGRVDQALSRLDTLLTRFDRDPIATEGSPPDAGALSGLLVRPPPETGLHVELYPCVLEAWRLRDLLSSNNDPVYGYAPLCGPIPPGGTPCAPLLRLLPREDHYARNLRALRARFPRAQVTDNIDLELAKTAPDDAARARLLREFLDTYESTAVDAVPEALFRLGAAYLSLGDRARAAEPFDRLLTHFPDSIWARQARRYAPPATGIERSAGGRS